MNDGVRRYLAWYGGGGWLFPLIGISDMIDIIDKLSRSVR